MSCELWLNYVAHIERLQRRADAPSARPKDAALHGLRRSVSRLYTDRCAGYLPQPEADALWDETVERILAERQTALIVPLFLWEEATAAVPVPPPDAYPYVSEPLGTGSIVILRDGAGRDRAVLRVTGMSVLSFASMTDELAAAEGIYPGIAQWRSAKARRYKRLLAARGMAFAPVLPLQVLRLDLLYTDG